MSVTVNELLACASHVLAGAASEVGYRNALGRAYYAAYHDCVGWHNSLASGGTLPAQGKGVHAKLIHQLANPTVTGDTAFKSRQRAYLLKHMKSSREKADYDLHTNVSSADAAQVISYAQQMLTIV